MGSTSPFLSIHVQGFASVQSAIDGWSQQHFRHLLYSPPRILILHLCRFKFGGRLRHAMRITPTLHMPSCASAETGGDQVRYHLIGGIVQRGTWRILVTIVPCVLPRTVVSTSGMPPRPLTSSEPLRPVQNDHGAQLDPSSTRPTVDLLNPLTIRLHDDGCHPVVGSSSTLQLLLHNAHVLSYTRADR